MGWAMSLAVFCQHHKTQAWWSKETIQVFDLLKLIRKLLFLYFFNVHVYFEYFEKC
jgi:hypothetical protein